MTSRRRRSSRTTTTRSLRSRRTRTMVTSLIVLVVVTAGGWLLHDTGAGSAAIDAPSISTGPDATEPSRASRPTVEAATGAAPTDGADPSAAAMARTQLAALPVKGKAPATGYDRVAQFGTAWLDVDQNGCDTRNDVLARDLVDVERRGPCTVLRGELTSPYTGQHVDFVRGNTTSTLVQIDHVVALENAWRTGAQQLSLQEREALANDPANLFAVDGHSNAQKRSGDAATWLPAATGFRCTYVEHQVAVKTTYRLWVTPAERDAMARVLDRCTGPTPG
ncbi:HNH endonuclease family protein [Curtobacterium sp. MCBA15_004]|uniref:HNH endonuclease family protein n=2 Tax=unclassified Curtobacterium TaxID=257496 RepID=UPI0009F1C2ED|nr:HNH endonuclease family protein [Curtobacterium sp. MCBA15_004]WIA98016.1 HNH endonuclease family protein [Curtobacterium sp. MCBA15_004]